MTTDSGALLLDGLIACTAAAGRPDQRAQLNLWRGLEAIVPRAVAGFRELDQFAMDELVGDLFFKLMDQPEFAGTTIGEAINFVSRSAMNSAIDRLRTVDSQARNVAKQTPLIETSINAPDDEPSPSNLRGQIRRLREIRAILLMLAVEHDPAKFAAIAYWLANRFAQIEALCEMAPTHRALPDGDFQPNVATNTIHQRLSRGGRAAAALYNAHRGCFDSADDSMVELLFMSRNKLPERPVASETR